MVTPKPEFRNNNGCSIKVGATGTISSLMSQELEAPKASSSTQKKPQSAPVSLPCGSTSRISHPRRYPTNESNCSNSSGSNVNIECKKARNAQKLRHNSRTNCHGVPMLVSEDIVVDRNDSGKERKANSYIVEVVDLKCSNPMSSRLKKFGFSKLSESTV